MLFILMIFFFQLPQVSCNMNHLNSVGSHSSLSTKPLSEINSVHSSTKSFKTATSSFSKDGNSFKVSYKPLNDTIDSESSNPRPAKISASSSYDTLHQNKINSFHPDMTSTPMSLSRASSKNIPDVVQPASLNSLVQTAAYDTKDKYDGPVVKVTIQNPRPYTPMNFEFPPPTKAPGKTSEHLTKTSYSETTLTRLTCNTSSMTALITEVRF